MERTKQELEKGGIIIYKAEKVVDGAIENTFEESYYKDLAPEFSQWKYNNALEELKPNGALMKYYMKIPQTTRSMKIYRKQL